MPTDVAVQNYGVAFISLVLCRERKGCVHNNGLPRAGFGITRHRYGRRDFSVALVYFLCDFDRENAKISQFRSLKSPVSFDLPVPRIYLCDRF